MKHKSAAGCRKNKTDRIKNTGRKLLPAMLAAAAFALTAAAFTAGSTVEAEAAYAYSTRQQLETPEPWLEGDYTAAWDRVEHAASYTVKVSIKNPETGRTVTRSFSTTSNREDLRFFAAGCDVTFSVQAVPSSSTSPKYRSSYSGACEEGIEPDPDNGTVGLAGISGGRYYLESFEGGRMTGWAYINGCWYYLDPAENGLAVKNAWKTVNGRTYLFTAESKMATGWQAWNGKWYYLDSKEGYMYTGWRQVTPNRLYYFTESASDGQPVGSLDEAVTTASYPDSRPPYTLSTGTTANPQAAGQTEQQTAAQPVNRWKQNPDGSWSYLKNNTAVKNGWEKVDGFWYYFNGKGIMLTGWQFINSRWYYLEPSEGGTGGYKCGAMWSNATTPDGYTVNADGCWVQNGAVVTTAGGGKSAASSASGSGSGSSSGSSSGSGSQSGTAGGTQAANTDRAIGYCNISLRISETIPGRCRTAEVTGASYCTVKNVTYSASTENRTPGTPVTITVTLEADSGYVFADSTKYSVSSAKLSGQDGTSKTRNVRIAYYPTVRLSAPASLYVNDSYELKWAPVKYAERYKVVITGGDSKTATKYVTEPAVDLYEFGDIDGSSMSASVTALGPEGNKYYLESERASTGDLSTLKRTCPMNGEFVRTGGKLKYVQEDGTNAAGWQYLAGSWYHFKNTGPADGPGWFQDTTGYWYYFDDSFKMLTGMVTEGDTAYFLNDGRRTDLPLGAWIR